MGIDYFKCERCERIFDEFEADYNFMSREGRELCPECRKVFKKEENAKINKGG